MVVDRTRARARITSLLTVVTLGVAATTLVGPAVGAPEPDESGDSAIESAEAKVERLYHQAEVASESYNDARVSLDATNRRLASLNRDLRRQRAHVGQMRSQVVTLVVDQYQNQALSTASQVLFSADPDAFLDNLSAVTTYNTQRSETMGEYSVELQRLGLRRAAVAKEQAALAELEESLRTTKAQIDERAAEAEAALDELEAKERKKFLAGDSTAEVPDVQAGGRAAAAVKWAMAQVGKSYVYGAAGPSAFDCSGLTMRAWGAAGVGLSHSSRVQINEGRRVSRDELQPGDLVFYYSPISHVGMYIGNGMIVNALNPGSGVKVSGVDSMPFAGATRPG